MSHVSLKGGRRHRWYLRRLWAMTPAEVRQRALVHARHAGDDLAWWAARPLWQRWWYPAHDAAVPPAPVGFLVSERARLLRDADPESAGQLVARADDVLHGRFRFSATRRRC